MLSVSYLPHILHRSCASSEDRTHCSIKLVCKRCLLKTTLFPQQSITPVVSENLIHSCCSPSEFHKPLPLIFVCATAGKMGLCMQPWTNWAGKNSFFRNLRPSRVSSLRIQIYNITSTGLNDKIVVLKKTTLQLYFKTFIEKINSGNLIMLESWHLFNVATFSLNHRFDSDPELGACLFLKRRQMLGAYSADGGDQAGFGVVGGHVGDVLDVWPNEVVKWVQIWGGGGPVREGYKVVALLLKPSLGLFGLVGHTQGLPPATWLHQGVTTLFSTSRYTLMLTFKPTSKMWGGMMWPSLETTPKTITVAGSFVFITLGMSLLFVVLAMVLAMVLLS